MHNQLGYPYPYQHPVAHQQAAQPPSFEGTALAMTLGAGAGALVTQGVMFLGNFQPKTLLANGLVTAGVAAFGGTTGAMTYRMNASRAYQSAQQMGHGGPNSLRLSGRLGRLGQVDINVPVQGIVEAGQAYQRAMNPFTPNLVHQYYEEAAKHAAEVAAQGFAQCMPPPQTWSTPPPPPQPQQAYYYPPPPPPPPNFYHPQPQYQHPQHQPQGPSNGQQ